MEMICRLPTKELNNFITDKNANHVVQKLLATGDQYIRNILFDRIINELNVFDFCCSAGRHKIIALLQKDKEGRHRRFISNVIWINREEVMLQEYGNFVVLMNFLFFLFDSRNNLIQYVMNGLLK